MTENERWEYLLRLDDELLLGGVVLSEWCTFIVRESNTAFAKGANLASIIIALSGIETYLRSEYPEDGKKNLYTLVEHSPIASDLKLDIHRLRKFRNRWVHVEEPWEDEPLLDHPEDFEHELEEMAFFAAKLLRRTIYENQWI
jgi:hypothetical protein